MRVKPYIDPRFNTIDFHSQFSAVAISCIIYYIAFDPVLRNVLFAAGSAEGPSTDCCPIYDPTALQYFLLDTLDLPVCGRTN